MRFLLVNFVLSVLLGYLYILFTPSPHGLLGNLFVHFALLSNYITVYLIVAVLLFVIVGLFPWRIVLYVVPPVAMSALHILNFMDVAIFRLYHIHINSMVLNLVFTEGVEDSLHFSKSTFLCSAVVVVTAVLFELFLMRKLHKRLSDRFVSRRWIMTLSLSALLVVIADKAIYAAADLYNNREITRHARVFPLYQRATIKRFMQKHFDFQVNREDQIVVDRGSSGLHYPKGELAASALSSYPNIVWILIDAWRYDMLSEETTPNVSEFSRDAVVFNNHYSGGNASRFGVFSLFYGVYASYWHQFLGERQSPVFIDELTELGYDFEIVSATKLTNPEFRKTAFVRIPQFIEDELEGENALQKDPALTEAFLRWLDDRDTTKPFFSFLFYDAPHGPAVYPDEFEKFTPAIQQPNYLTVSESEAPQLRNAYKNAIYFDDHQVGRVLSALEQKGLLENTIILISGDHGEEFYESGFFGHTSSFSKQQTKVPLVLRIPGEEPRNVERLTSHIDVVPTMFELLGYNSAPHIYSQGSSLLSGKEREFVVVSGWDDCAMINDQATLVFSFETYNMAKFEVRDTLYRLVDDRAVLGESRQYLMKVLEGFGEFLK